MQESRIERSASRRAALVDNPDSKDLSAGRTG